MLGLWIASLVQGSFIQYVAFRSAVEPTIATVLNGVGTVFIGIVNGVGRSDEEIKRERERRSVFASVHGYERYYDVVYRTKQFDKYFYFEFEGLEEVLLDLGYHSLKKLSNDDRKRLMSHTEDDGCRALIEYMEDEKGIDFSVRSDWTVHGFEWLIKNQQQYDFWSKRHEIDFNRYVHPFCRPLVDAVVGEDWERVEFLLDNGADPTYISESDPWQLSTIDVLQRDWYLYEGCCQKGLTYDALQKALNLFGQRGFDVTEFKQDKMQSINRKLGSTDFTPLINEMIKFVEVSSRQGILALEDYVDYKHNIVHGMSLELTQMTMFLVNGNPFEDIMRWMINNAMMNGAFGTLGFDLHEACFRLIYGYASSQQAEKVFERIILSDKE